MLCSVDPIYDGLQMHIPIIMFLVGIFPEGMHYVLVDALVLHQKTHNEMTEYTSHKHKRFDFLNNNDLSLFCVVKTSVTTGHIHKKRVT